MNENLDLKQNNPAEEKGGNVRKVRKILVADDKEKMRQLLVEVLTIFGYEVVEASDGQALLDKVFSEEEFDAVITDNDMPPGMEGIDALKQIRAKNPDLPFILLSGLLNDDLESKVKELGNSRCFQKPFNIEKIKEALEEMILIPTDIIKENIELKKT